MLIHTDAKVLSAQNLEIASKNNVTLKSINFLNNARSASLFEQMIGPEPRSSRNVRGYANPLLKPLAIVTQRSVHSGIRDFAINPIETSAREGGNDRW